MDDLTNPTPATGGTATPTATTTNTATVPAPTTGTVQPGGEASNRQSAPAEEGFTQIDPNTLPPQLRQSYDNMLRDYKKKTGELSEERKKYDGFDAYKKDAEQYRQILSQAEFVKRWNEFVEQQGQTNNQDPVQSKLLELEKQLQEEKQARRHSELAEVVDAFSAAKDEKGELINPDFNPLNEIVVGKNQKGEEFSLLRVCIELGQGETPQERLANGYKSAKAIRDQIFEEGRKHGMGKMLSKVRGSTEAPTMSSDKSLFNGDPTKLTVREARELAQKGIVVK